jgi:tripartite-type tricarboxylate transporter receptor subunit TctC
MPKYIPGSPHIIVENRAGAGSLIAANMLFNMEPKDGTVFGTIGEGLPLQQRLGARGVSFDAAKLNWLGSAVQTTYACAARAGLGITADELLAGKNLIMASSDPGSSPYDVPAVLKEALGLNLKLVAGYRSTPVMVQSIERQETDALCTTLSTLIEPAGRALLGGDRPVGKLFLVIAEKIPLSQANHVWVKGTPSAERLAKSQEAKALLAAFDAPARMHKPFVAPPQVPPERIAMLRRALTRTFEDDSFRAEVSRLSLVASPISGEETTEIVQSVLNTSEETVAILRRILK